MHETIENWLVKAPGRADRIEACFTGAAFSPHRHDTYAIGLTLRGVQSFDYRGATRHSLAGHVVVLHPDELHDGRAGNDEPFHYRTIYLEPALIQLMLDGQSLPFIPGGVSTDPRLKSAVEPLLVDFDHPPGEMEFQDAVFSLAMALSTVAGTGDRLGPTNFKAAGRARNFMDCHLDRQVGLEELERVVGVDRWRLSRDFRTAFGTSPYRYLTLRRLDRARELLLAGSSIADAAAACSFADQSHFTRQFRRTFGLTPKSWLNMMKTSRRTIVL